MSFYQSSEGGMASLSQSSNSRSCRPTWWHENQNTAALRQHFGFYKTKYTPLPTTQLNNVPPFTDSISSQRLIRKDTSSIKVGQGPTTSQSDTTEPPWPTVSSLETVPHTGRLIFFIHFKPTAMWQASRPTWSQCRATFIVMGCTSRSIEYRDSGWRSFGVRVRLSSYAVLRSCPRCWTSFVPVHQSKNSLQAFTNTRGLLTQAAWSFNSILTTNNYFNLVMYLRPQLPIQRLDTHVTKFDAFCTWIGSEGPQQHHKEILLFMILYMTLWPLFTAQCYYKINIKTGEWPVAALSSTYNPGN